MLFPIGDDDRRISGPSLVTKGLVAANIAVWFFFQDLGANDLFTYGYSVIPAEIMTGADLVAPQAVQVGDQVVEVPQAPGPTPIHLTILTAMFMHGGWMHLLGNLLYLWIFGDNVEHRFGSRVFLLFYLVSGIAATFAQVVMAPMTVVPNLGASGAISGVLGAYLILFPRNRVHTLIFYFVVSVPAAVVLGLWIAMQFVNGFGATALTQQTGGIAYGAHIGGFVAGVVLAIILRTVIKAPERVTAFDKVAPYDHSRRVW